MQSRQKPVPPYDDVITDETRLQDDVITDETRLQDDDILDNAAELLRDVKVGNFPFFAIYIRPGSQGLLVGNVYCSIHCDLVLNWVLFTELPTLHYINQIGECAQKSDSYVKKHRRIISVVSQTSMTKKRDHTLGFKNYLKVSNLLQIKSNCSSSGIDMFGDVTIY